MKFDEAVVISVPGLRAPRVRLGAQWFDLLSKQTFWRYGICAFRPVEGRNSDLTVARLVEPRLYAEVPDDWEAGRHGAGYELVHHTEDRELFALMMGFTESIGAGVDLQDGTPLASLAAVAA